MPADWDGGGRTFWWADKLNDKTLRGDPRRRVERADANLVASKTVDGRHMVTIDVDHPAALVPSSSPGHFHLFIDVPMTWRAYRRLLRALRLSGIVGRSVYWRSLDRGASFVRPPGVHKTDAERERSTPDRSRVTQRQSRRALNHIRVRVMLKRVGWNAAELWAALRSAAARNRAH